MTAAYDIIGVDYADLRRPDPRIAAQLHRKLGTAKTVLNVGAGTGSYEPADRQVTAVEPSAEMIRQRSPGAARVMQGGAEALPFADDVFDASMAVLTVHHWSDKARGLAEMRRVTSGPVLLLTHDPAYRGNWLTDYLPELIALDEDIMPDLSDYSRWLGPVEIWPVAIPQDCRDGFLYAYWRRPRAYLDPRIRRGISSFWAIANVAEKLGALARDLDSGNWLRKYGEVEERAEWDAGYRLVVSQSS